MSVSSKNFSVADYLAVAPQVGLPARIFIPQNYRALCSTVAQRNVPSKAPSGFVTLTTACLIARGMIYWKSNPGDCGSPSHLDLEGAQITGAVGNIATGIASMAGQALPGIGVAVAAIQQIFAHHAQAVVTEQTTICRVQGVMNQVFVYYDSLVASGRLSPSAAYAGIQNFIQQVTEQLSAIEKTCNSACVWIGVLNAHADFAESYYPLIAPAQYAPHAPGAPPASLGTSPGGVVYVGGGLQNTLTPQGAVGAAGFSTSEILIGILALLVILFMTGVL